MKKIAFQVKEGNSGYSIKGVVTTAKVLAK